MTKKIFALSLILLLALGATISYGASLFTDVKEDNWAAPYIGKVVEKKLMPGYADATYKPGKNVTKLEVMTALYNVAIATGKFDKTQAEMLVVKHKKTIKAAHIPETLEPYGTKTWSAVAFGLENQILHPDELKGFVTENKLAEATKLEAVIFTGKIMNLSLKEDLQRIISFDYKDAIRIPRPAAPYVDILIQHGVISKKGDENRNFNPTKEISRNVLATIVSGAYDVLSGKPSPSKINKISSLNSNVEDKSKPFDSTIGVGEKTYKGIVSVVHKDLSIVEIRDGGGKLHVYDGSKAEYERDGNSLKLENIQSGMDVLVKEKDKKLIKVTVNKQFDKITGHYLESSETLTDEQGSYQVITVSTSEGKKYYKLYKDALVIRNGQSADVENLEKGDRLAISAEGFLVREVEAHAEKTVVEGILNRASTFKKGSLVSVKLNEGRYIDQTLDKDIEVVGDDGVLSKGDIVKVTLTYGSVSQIEDTGQSSEISGTITSIFISELPQVVLKVGEKKKTVNLDGNVTYILSDNKEEGSIYDLRLNQPILVKIDGNSGKTVTASKPLETKKWNGEIIEIYHGANLLKAKDDTGKIWTVSFKSEAAVSLLKYQKGDRVFFVGSPLSGDVFEAELIIGNQ